MKARGFVERAGMVFCAALPPSEFAKLRQAMAFSDAEEEMVTSWTNPPAAGLQRDRDSPTRRPAAATSSPSSAGASGSRPTSTSQMPSAA
jgi:hypothetical protein